MIGLAKKVWLPLLIVFVVVVAGLTVSRIRTFFGSEGIIETPRNFADLPEPFDPEGGPLRDLRHRELRRHQLPRPGRQTAARRRCGAAVVAASLSTTEPSAAPNIVAQGDGSTITCRIFVDDELKDEKTSDGLNAQTFCFVKSA